MTAPTRTRAGRTGAPAPVGRRRAVLLSPEGPNGPRWIRTCAEFADAQRLDVVAIARRVEDALAEVASGRADVLVVPRPEDLAPLVQIVTLPTAPNRPDTRRPQRLR